MFSGTEPNAFIFEGEVRIHFHPLGALGCQYYTVQRQADTCRESPGLSNTPFFIQTYFPSTVFLPVKNEFFLGLPIHF